MVLIDDIIETEDITSMNEPEEPCSCPIQGISDCLGFAKSLSDFKIGVVVDPYGGIKL